MIAIEAKEEKKNRSEDNEIMDSSLIFTELVNQMKVVVSSEYWYGKVSRCQAKNEGIFSSTDVTEGWVFPLIPSPHVVGHLQLSNTSIECY